MDQLCYLCLMFVMLSRLVIAALWSPSGKGLASWLMFVKGKQLFYYMMHNWCISFYFNYWKLCRYSSIMQNCLVLWHLFLKAKWYYTIIDYWGIWNNVLSTWEYQYWPRRSITSSTMTQQWTIVVLYNFSKQQSNNSNNEILAMNFAMNLFFKWWLTISIQLKEKLMHNNSRQLRARWNAA